jgi:hypothetical protein
MWQWNGAEARAGRTGSQLRTGSRVPSRSATSTGSLKLSEWPGRPSRGSRGSRAQSGLQRSGRVSTPPRPNRTAERFDPAATRAP